MLFERTLKLCIDVIALLVEAARLVEDGRELLARRQAALVVNLVGLDVLEVEQAPDAHHEEFIEVAREDFDELHALEERHGLVRRFVEHALVETQPRKLAVLRVAGIDSLFQLSADVEHQMSPACPSAVPAAAMAPSACAGVISVAGASLPGSFGRST